MPVATDDGYYLCAPSAEVGRGTKIWHFSHVMRGAKIGRDCTLGQNSHVAPGVVIGDGCRIQNNVSLYRGVELGDDVFVGPSVVFTNVLTPRAAVFRETTAYARTHVQRGATIGANATILCGITIGEYAMIGAGAVVTKSVAPYALAYGNPAVHTGWVCACGETLRPTYGVETVVCGSCVKIYRFDGLAPSISPLVLDPDAPYVCLGCSTPFATCPDADAHNCPKCGDKVCPVRLWKRKLRCEKEPCDGGTSFIRADGNCLCPTCGIAYADHPFCANSVIPASLQSSIFPEYILHVLCGSGLHVKL